MKNIRICKENECRNKVAGGKRLISCAAHILGYCRRHYLEHFPKSKRRNLPACRKDSAKILNWTERIFLEQMGFNPEAWSPEFRREMAEYLRARMKGEI